MYFILATATPMTGARPTEAPRLFKSPESMNARLLLYTAHRSYVLLYTNIVPARTVLK